MNNKIISNIHINREKYENETNNNKNEKSENEKSENEKSEKNISIIGTNTRYQMKKVMKQKEEKKEKKYVNSDYFKNKDDEFFLWDKQIEIINEIYVKNDFDYEYEIIKKQLSNKLSGYKQQDIKKNRFIENNFITLNKLIDKLKESHLKCYYCNDKIYLLYKLVREIKQWSLDRLNNDIGHEHDNVIICCLECNLKRRLKNSNAFLFTKNLNITKTDNNSGQ